MKGGVMEVGDLIVVNKCDLPGAEDVRQEILAALALRSDGRERPEVLLSSGVSGAGVAAILDALDARVEALQADDRRLERRLRVAADRVRAALREVLEEVVLGRSARAGLLVQEVADGRRTAHDAAEALLADLTGGDPGRGRS
jgi:LAO/AO transport system kinase